MTYGSAYSGVDTFAAAVEAEMAGDWNYEFASEASKTVRSGLEAAPGRRTRTKARRRPRVLYAASSEETPRLSSSSTISSAFSVRVRLATRSGGS